MTARPDEGARLARLRRTDMPSSLAPRTRIELLCDMGVTFLNDRVNEGSGRFAGSACLHVTGKIW